MSNLAPTLIDRLATPAETGIDVAVLLPLLQLLSAGEPVEVAALAAAADLAEDDLRQRLAAAPETEYDAEGRILGLGLTLRPTAHRFTLAGQELYIWCAFDTLLFPPLLDRVAHVESTSPVGHVPVRAEVGPSGVVSVEPSTAVVSFVNPDDMTSIRSSFCNQVNFFVSAEEARPWLTAHPEAEVVPVSEAFQLGLGLLARHGIDDGVSSCSTGVCDIDASLSGESCCS